MINLVARGGIEAKRGEPEQEAAQVELAIASMSTSQHLHDHWFGEGERPDRR